MEFDKNGILPELTKRLDDVGIEYYRKKDCLIYLIGEDSGNIVYSVLSPCDQGDDGIKREAFVMSWVGGFDLDCNTKSGDCNYKDLEETYKEILRLYINYVWE